MKDQKGNESWFSLNNIDLPIRRGHHVAVVIRSGVPVGVLVQELNWIYYPVGAHYFLKSPKGGCWIFVLMFFFGPTVLAILMTALSYLGMPDFNRPDKLSDEQIAIAVGGVFVGVPILVSMVRSFFYKARLKRLKGELKREVDTRLAGEHQW